MHVYSSKFTSYMEYTYLDFDKMYFLIFIINYKVILKIVHKN